MTEGRLCQSSKAECLNRRSQLVERTIHLEESILSLKNEKNTLEDTNKHLQREAKRFKEKVIVIYISRLEIIVFRSID